MRGVLDFYQEDVDDIDEPVERYERVFDSQLLPLIRTKFVRDSEVRDLVYAFDVLRELIDDITPHQSKYRVLTNVLVRISDREDYKRRLTLINGFFHGPLNQYELFDNPSYTSLTLLETFTKKREYELIYRFMGLFEDNTVRFSLDGKQFIIQKDDKKRKILNVGFIWFHDIELGKGITLGIKAEVDPFSFLTIDALDDDL